MARLLIAALLLLTACITVDKTEPEQTASDSEAEGYREWAGPGLYWGVYINNENDYWHHYNYHYHGNRPHDHPDGRGPHGGGGHGGGHR